MKDYSNSVTETSIKKTNEVDQNEYATKYIKHKLTKKDKLREKISAIRVSAECIIEDTYDADFIMDHLQPEEFENTVTRQDLVRLNSYLHRIDSLLEDGIPYFKEYIIEREYDYE